MKFEARGIVELCRRQLSVGIGVPLGAARVLIADLVGENMVSFRESTELSICVSERIRDLVRAL